MTLRRRWRRRRSGGDGGVLMISETWFLLCCGLLSSCDVCEGDDKSRRFSTMREAAKF